MVSGKFRSTLVPNILSWMPNESAKMKYNLSVYHYRLKQGLNSVQTSNGAHKSLHLPTIQSFLMPVIIAWKWDCFQDKPSHTSMELPCLLLALWSAVQKVIFPTNRNTVLNFAARSLQKFFMSYCNVICIRIQIESVQSKCFIVLPFFIGTLIVTSKQIILPIYGLIIGQHDWLRSHIDQLFERLCLIRVVPRERCNGSSLCYE